MPTPKRPPRQPVRRLQPRLICAVTEALEVRRHLAAHIVGNPTVFPTIQGAVDAAPIGATINVDPGTYSELVVVHKQLTLRGAKAGIDGRSNARTNRAAESIVNGQLNMSGTRSSSFYVIADNVVLDGFTIEGQTATGNYGAAIHMNANRAGVQVLNNIVQDNSTGMHLSNNSTTAPLVVRKNLFRNNNVDGPHRGRALYSDGSLTGGVLRNVIIDQNAFVANRGVASFPYEPAIGFEALNQTTVQTDIQITNNTFDSNGKHLLAFNASNLTITGNWFQEAWDTTSAGIRFEGGMTNVTIQNNNIYGTGARAIRIDKKASSGNNSNFVITGNNLYRVGLDTDAQNSALYVNQNEYGGPIGINATNNWWGSASGPSGDGPGTGVAVRAFGNPVTFSGHATSPFANLQQGAYWGAPATVTSRIQLEDYDHGGTGVAYSDTTGNNIDDQLHPYEGVDIATTADAGGGHAVTNVKATEWLEYTVTVPTTGTYTMVARVANAAAGGAFHVEVGATNVTGSVAVPNTGGLTTFADVTKTGVNLTAGTYVIRVAFDAQASNALVGNFNWIQFTGGTPAIPAAPSGLTATAVSSSQINLVWADNSSNETGFIVERSPNGTTGWTTVATPAAGATSFSNNTGLSANTQYFYRVRAAGAGGESANSNTASATTLAANAVTFIPAGASWKYLDNGSNQGTAWRSPSFIDTSWTSGNAELGYGDGDEATTVSYGPSTTIRYVTTYFRKQFSVNGAVSSLTMRLIRDDGAVVYLNGTEIYRSNMPGAPGTSPAYNQLASSTVNEPDESAWQTYTLTPAQRALLVQGANNVIAVEIHQAVLSSSDISFNLDLKGTSLPQPPPEPPLPAPSALSTTVLSQTQVRLDWLDTVNGETGFRIERSSDGVNFTEITTVAANTSTWTNSGLTAGTSYWYRVCAYNAIGNSYYSGPSKATTQAAPVGLPAPWVTADIGAVAASGSATHSGGVFTVAGSGNDIWFNADEFRYVYQPWSGNGTITARVNSLTNTHVYAKAGIMFRESLAAGSRQASVHLTPGNESVMTYRQNTDGTSDGFFNAGGFPRYLRLVRNGTSFTSHVSTNGTTWTLVGTQTISMGANIYVGLAVTSKLDGTLATASFDNVSVSNVVAASVAAATLEPAPETTRGEAVADETLAPADPMEVDAIGEEEPSTPAQPTEVDTVATEPAVRKRIRGHDALRDRLKKKLFGSFR